MRANGLRFANRVIPEADLSWSYDTSGGPGGQHANRAATRVTLSVDLSTAGEIGRSERDRLLERLGDRASSSVVSVTVDDTRSQWRNRAIARRRLTDLLERASIPERTRRATNPSIRSRRQRLEAKRRRGRIKRLRKSPGIDEE